MNQNYSRGFENFVNSVSAEIMKLNQQLNPSEVRRIVEGQWMQLNDEQKGVYERIANETQNTISRLAT